MLRIQNICFVIVLALTTIIPANAFAEENPTALTCHRLADVPDEHRTLGQRLDEHFGVVVEKMAMVLFWNPFTFEVHDENGNPVMQDVPYTDTEGRKLEQHFLIIDASPKPVADKTAAACLDVTGNLQFAENAQPWLTTWRFENGAFTHATPFTKEGVVYLKKENGGGYHKEKAFLSETSHSPKTEGLPLVVLVLFFGAVFYTIYYGFINLRLFRHAIDCTRGIFSDPTAPGEVSHFQALTTALSATVGLGNIAGVAVAVGLGGPGAVFWMILSGLLGMTSKFHECSLAQMYRLIDSEGRVHGGPKYFLSKGLGELGFPGIGKVLALIFAVFVIGGSFGGGNMFQANQCYQALAATIPFLADKAMLFGLFMAFLVGLVIIGGIKRIAHVTDKLVPFMCGLYVLVSLYIVFSHWQLLPEVFGLIFTEAFSFKAGFGGFIGICVMGIKRAVFSNEAGIGSASIAHSAAKTTEPVREGIVSLLEPFIDTVVICSMTAFVVLVTGAYNNPIAGSGVEMTRFAFSQEVSWFPSILSISVFLFAFSTMISWSYYGERGWEYLFGYTPASITTYRVIFLVFIVIGCISSLGNVIEFSDLMILAMAFPNIMGGIWLSRKVKNSLNGYMKKLKSGEMRRYK